MKNFKTSNKAELPTSAVQQNAHRKQMMDGIVNIKNMESDERDVENDNDKLSKGLHEPANATQ